VEARTSSCGRTSRHVIRPHEPRGRGKALRSKLVCEDLVLTLVVRGLALVVFVIRARWKKHATNKQVKLLRIRNKSDSPQGLILTRGLDDELAVSE
jgi:hypothetical protein